MFKFKKVLPVLLVSATLMACNSEDTSPFLGEWKEQNQNRMIPWTVSITGSTAGKVNVLWDAGLQEVENVYKVDQLALMDGNGKPVYRLEEKTLVKVDGRSKVKFIK